MTDTTELRAAFEAEVRTQLDPGRAAAYLARDDGQEQYHDFALCLAWHCWQAAHASATQQHEGLRKPIGNFILGRDGMPQAVSFYPEAFDALILERGTVTLYALGDAALSVAGEPKP